MRGFVQTFAQYIREQRDAIHFLLSRQSRKLASSANSKRIALNRHAISVSPRIAIDTGVLQLFGKKIVSPEVVWPSWKGRDTAFRKLDTSDDLQILQKTDEMKYCFAICEAFRAGSLRAVQLESIGREQAGASNIHFARYHGRLRLDYNVNYELFDFLDSITHSKEIFRRVNIDPTKIVDLNFPLDSKYMKLIGQLSGNSHKKDLIHLLASDIGRIDVFLTIDQKLINAFASYQNRKGVYQLGIKLMKPSELCSALKMKPIDIPIR